MISIRGTITGGRDTIAAFAQIPSLLRQGAERAMTTSLEQISTIIRTEFLSGPYPEFIQPRSGFFRASWRRGHRANIFRVRSEGTRVMGEIGTQDISAETLDVGATIRPKRGKFLAVPTDLAKTPAGVLKAQYQRRSWREVPNTFVGRSKTKVLYIAERQPGHGRQRRSIFRVLAWLVTEVTIRGRHFTQKTERRAKPGIEHAFRTMVTEILTRASRLGGREP